MNYTNKYNMFIDESIDKCYILVKGSSTSNDYIEVNKILYSIFLYSKLEDHPNIIILVEKTQSLLESFINGSKLTQNINTILKESLDRIRFNISNQIHGLDLDLIDKMENELDTVKKDERDFVFGKKLKVLFISNDEFLKESIIKINYNVEIFYSNSYQESFKRLENQPIDLILCDILNVDPIVEDFLKTYSKKFLIVAIYDENDPKIISQIAKMGIVYLIPRAQSGIKYLEKILHSSYYEWKKQKHRYTMKPILENPEIKIILHDMLITELPIVQKVSSFFVNEIEINPVIKKSYDIKLNDIIKTNSTNIDYLVNEKYLIKEEIKNVLTCPNCNAIDLDTNYMCKHCGSKTFVKHSDIVVHRLCEHADFRNNFKVINNYQCPKCKINLNLSIDCYTKTAFFCKECTDFFDDPKITLGCNHCNYSPFKFIDTKIKKIYKYRINPIFEKEFKKNFFIMEKLADYLINNGFKITYNEKLTKDFTSDIYADLIARRNDYEIILVILSPHLEYNIELLHNLDILKRENYNIIPIILSLEEPNQILFNLIIKFGIYLLVSENANEIFNKSREHLYSRISSMT